MPRRAEADPVAAKVGARIRTLRLEQRMTIAELAERAGQSKGHVSSIERGFVMITVGTLILTANALGVPPFWLVLFPDEDPFAAVSEQLRNEYDGNTAAAAARLRQLAFKAEAVRASALSASAARGVKAAQLAKKKKR
jgi:transcriptional regulator with XRE-family HTH domain